MHSKMLVLKPFRTICWKSINEMKKTNNQTKLLESFFCFESVFVCLTKWFGRDSWYFPPIFVCLSLCTIHKTTWTFLVRVYTLYPHSSQLLCIIERATRLIPRYYEFQLIRSICLYVYEIHGVCVFCIHIVPP